MQREEKNINLPGEKRDGKEYQRRDLANAAKRKAEEESDTQKQSKLPKFEQEEQEEVVPDDSEASEASNQSDDSVNCSRCAVLPRYYSPIEGCRSVKEFECLNRIEEGSYGVVYQARDKRTGEIVALKCFKLQANESFPIISLREASTLIKGRHPNVVAIKEIVVGSSMYELFIVMECVEHDLDSVMEAMLQKKQTFMPGEVKFLLKQLLLAVAHLHDKCRILHRDLKPSNILLTDKGILKVADFGLAREFGPDLKPYTPIVATLWYRAPELLLLAGEYSTPIDMWSVGCIFGELLLMDALFPGKSEIDQLNKIFKVLGTPNEEIWPGFNQLPAVKVMNFDKYPAANLWGIFNMLSELGLGLLIKFLTCDPAQRITAEEALNHVYFNESPLPINPAVFPNWPGKRKLGQKRT